MDLVRRISALTLIVTLLLIGTPLPAHAADEESPTLTINGSPLMQLLGRTGSGVLGSFPSLLEQETG